MFLIENTRAIDLDYEIEGDGEAEQVKIVLPEKGSPGDRLGKKGRNVPEVIRPRGLKPEKRNRPSLYNEKRREVNF